MIYFILFYFVCIVKSEEIVCESECECLSVSDFFFYETREKTTTTISQHAPPLAYFLIWNWFKLFIQNLGLPFRSGGWGISDHGAASSSASINPGWLIPATCWWASHVHYRHWKCRARALWTSTFRSVAIAYISITFITTSHKFIVAIASHCKQQQQ